LTSRRPLSLQRRAGKMWQAQEHLDTS
jgi:hypothetical protein